MKLSDPQVFDVNNFWQWNIETKECIFSDSWCRNLGYEPDEIIHHEDTWKAHVHEECIPNVWAKLQPVLTGVLDFYKCKYRLRNKDNQYIWHLDTGRVIQRNDQGEAVLMEGYDIRIAC